MRKRKNINILWKAAFIVCMAFVILSSSNVKADNAIDIKNNFKETVVISKYDKKEGHVFCLADTRGDIIKVVSSDQSVATVKHGSFCFWLFPKKTGTTKITVTAMNGNKKVKRSGTVQIVKFKNPFRTLKIGGKNYASKLKSSYNLIHIKTKKSKIKLNFKLQPNWKIDPGRSSVWGSDTPGNLDGVIKAGQEYYLKKGEYLVVNMGLKNKKSGVRTTAHLVIRR